MMHRHNERRSTCGPIGVRTVLQEFNTGGTLYFSAPVPSILTLRRLKDAGRYVLT